MTAGGAGGRGTPPAPIDGPQGPGATQLFHFMENPDSSAFPLSRFGTQSRNFNIS